MGWGSNMVLLVVLTAAIGDAPGQEAADRFSGRYGHDASEPAYEPAWEVQRAGAGWRASTLAGDESDDAFRMSAAGRAAFWEKMHWPAATATDADCISWGEASPDLLQRLQDAPPVASPDTFGEALICHVPAASRQAIAWLADGTGDWFYYDPMAGVMSVRQLR